MCIITVHTPFANNSRTSYKGLSAGSFLFLFCPLVIKSSSYCNVLCVWILICFGSVMEFGKSFVAAGDGSFVAEVMEVSKRFVAAGDGSVRVWFVAADGGSQ